MNEFVKALEAAAASVPDADAGEYIGEDGLLYCSKCRTKKEVRVQAEFLPGGSRTYPMACKCAREKVDAEQAALDKKRRAPKIERLRKECFGVRMKALEHTFERDDRRIPEVSAALTKYAREFEKITRGQQGTGLLLHGGVGVGKTFYADCIANALVEREISCIVVKFSSLINELNERRDKQTYLNYVVTRRLLVIDDLGVERSSEYMQEQVFNIVDARYDTGLPLIVTTNLPLEEIKNPRNLQYKRIYDRILEMCHPIKVDGVSRRRESIKEGYHRRNSYYGLGER